MSAIFIYNYNYKEMKISLSLKAVALFFVISILFASGAKLYLNGESVGKTPYTLTDTRIIGSTNTVLLTMDGYEDFLGSYSMQSNISSMIRQIVLYHWVPEGR